jgi:hypothetical protein
MEVFQAGPDGHVQEYLDWGHLQFLSGGVANVVAMPDQVWPEVDQYHLAPPFLGMQ